jgi:hypothetical protein
MNCELLEKCDELDCNLVTYATRIGLPTFDLGCSIEMHLNGLEARGSRLRDNTRDNLDTATQVRHKGVGVELICHKELYTTVSLSSPASSATKILRNHFTEHRQQEIVHGDRFVSRSFGLRQRGMCCHTVDRLVQMG